MNNVLPRGLRVIQRCSAEHREVLFIASGFVLELNDCMLLANDLNAGYKSEMGKAWPTAALPPRFTKMPASLQICLIDDDCPCQTINGSDRPAPSELSTFECECVGFTGGN